jgi:radical SAM-linked protein
MDIVLNQPVLPAEALERIRPALPVGIELHSVEEVPLKAPTLQHLLRQAEYRVLVETDLPAEQLQERVAALLEADKINLTRRRKKRTEEIDLRPWLYELQLESAGQGETHLCMRLAAGPLGNLP